MSRWYADLEEEVSRVLAKHQAWRTRTGVAKLGLVRVHLAILHEPYLSLILSGRKTIESRFSLHHRPPYERVDASDLVLLKAVSGPIRGVAQVERAWFFQRDRDWQDVRAQFSDAMCATEDDFWRERAAKNFATLIKLRHVLRLPAISCEKKDRRAWVILNDPQRLW